MIVLQKPKVVQSLASSAVLVHVGVRLYTGSKQDKQISREVTDSKQAEPNAGKFFKDLMANVPEHKACKDDRQGWYNWIEGLTYDWAGSWRLLPNSRIPQLMEEFRQRKERTTQIHEAFFNVYQQAVSNAAFVQGAMFNAADYASLDEVRARCGVTLNISEVAQGDFRSNISQDVANDLAVHYERQVNDVVNKVMSDQASQLVDVLKQLSHCCEVVEKDGKVHKRKIYDTTLNKALDYIDTFKQFNITGDEKLEEARASLEAALKNINGEALKASVSMRSAVKSKIDETLKKFGSVDLV